MSLRDIANTPEEHAKLTALSKSFNTRGAEQTAEDRLFVYSLYLRPRNADGTVNTNRKHYLYYLDESLDNTPMWSDAMRELH